MAAEFRGISKCTAQWLETTAVRLAEGRFRLCNKGFLHPVSGRTAQFSTVFAAKTAYQIGLWEQWSAARRMACIEFLQSFQEEDGWFRDPWLVENIHTPWKAHLAALAGRRAWPPPSSRQRIEAIRAETRQSAETLLLLGARPRYPLPSELSSPRDVQAYIAAFDWSKPWAAASHLSHQLALLSINKVGFGLDQAFDEIVDAVLAHLDRIHDPETGGWFTGDPAPAMIINGAMKVFGGLQWLERPYPECVRLLDFALRQPLGSDGCGILNHLYVLSHALKGAPPGSRQEEVAGLAAKAFERIMEFHLPDGGFSFSLNRSQVSYYGARVSRGLCESDLHGTVMMTWGLAFVAALAHLPIAETGPWRVQLPASALAQGRTQP